MLRAKYNITSLRTISSRQCFRVASFTSSRGCSSPHQPNAPLELEASFRTFLKDADISMAHKTNNHYAVEQKPQTPRQLEIFPDDPAFYPETAPGWPEDEIESRESRKSPAAAFGSRQIGAVVLPKQLQSSVSRLIEDSDKPMLHVDAKRLFSEGDGERESHWDSSYDISYKSRRQAFRHSERDGTAFASVALPAHYSAIYSVLDHTKQRLGSDWQIQRVIDWGAGTGSGLWASAFAFQKAVVGGDPTTEELILDNSRIESYLGIDKREGLVTIAKRLLQNVRRGDMAVSWQKSFQEDDRVPRSKGSDLLALSSFMLSSIPAPLSRKAVVKEMWESGAHTIVIIDHSSQLGFECIAEARQYLLGMGAKEVEDSTTADWDIRGSYVVAPCPHDSPCPLYHPGSNRLICGFEQRLQRPAFVRKTKHSGVGHEDVGYSYVVVRRGIRPSTTPDFEIGRLGPIGKEEQEKMNEKLQEPRELTMSGGPVDEVEVTKIVGTTDTEMSASESKEGDELESAMRDESFNWPRLVFPPLKRSGHVILDCCTPEGKIMRLTVPKSQGKQPYYDARKSQWGDLFPHNPKNKAVERWKSGGSPSNRGEDIGKRAAHADGKQRGVSYEKLGAEIKERKKKERKTRSRRRDIFEDLD